MVKNICCLSFSSQVPDRGGRPRETRPPPEMPSFKRRTEAPKDQRGGGASGRGHGKRGGGRGGGRVQGGIYIGMTLYICTCITWIYVIKFVQKNCKIILIVADSPKKVR